MDFQRIHALASNTQTVWAPHLLDFFLSSCKPATPLPNSLSISILPLPFITILQDVSNYIQIFKGFSVLNDDKTVEAGNQLFSTTLQLVLQIKASNNSIINSKLADAKTTSKLSFSSGILTQTDMKQLKV